MTATPTKREELNVLTLVLDHGLTPRAAARTLGVPWKRMARWCEKWASRWDYDWGVCIDLGWFPEERKDEVRSWIAERWQQMTFQPDDVVKQALMLGARSCALCKAEHAEGLHQPHDLMVERVEGRHGVWWYLVICELHGGWRVTAAPNVDAAIANWNAANDREEAKRG